MHSRARSEAILDRVLSRLPSARPSGNGWIACCPAHDDSSPSLSVKIGDSGALLLKCFAGCATSDVVAALGVDLRALFPEERPADRPSDRASAQPIVDLAIVQARFAAALPAERLAALARELGVTAAALRALEIGWATADDLRTLRAGGKDWNDDYPRGAYSFPETDADGNIVGFSFRATDGRKGSPSSSVGCRRGLIVPTLFGAAAGPVLCVEGASDVAACHVLGLPAVGRPSCSGGADDLKKLKARLGSSELVIVGENDKKPDGRWPGRDGAIAVARQLGCKWALPPAGAKDVRAWLGARVADGLDLDDVAACRAAGKELLASLRAAAQTERSDVRGDPAAEPAAGGDPVPAADPDGERPRVTMRCLADVTPEDVRWLWPGRVPLGKLSLLAGDPGLGKSFVTLDAAARVTVGAAWPDGEAACEPGEVILLSAEDDAADTLVPRLRAHGADLRRVRTLDAVREGDRERSFSLALDAARLDAVLTDRGGSVRLVVIDPVSAYLSGLKDSHNNSDVRGVLAPIAALAARHRCAIVAVTHLNKGGGANACYRATGSLAFAAAARAVWLVARDPADARRRLLLPVKTNLAADVGGLAYAIDAVPGRGPCVCWEADAVRMSADEFLALQAAAAAAAGKRGRPAQRPPSPERREALEFVRDFLAGGAKTAAEIYVAARAADVSKNAVRGALRAAARKQKAATPDGPWTYSLVEDVEDEGVRQGEGDTPSPSTPSIPGGQPGDPQNAALFCNDLHSSREIEDEGAKIEDEAPPSSSKVRPSPSTAPPPHLRPADAADDPYGWTSILDPDPPPPAAPPASDDGGGDRETVIL